MGQTAPRISCEAVARCPGWEALGDLDALAERAADAAFAAAPPPPGAWTLCVLFTDDDEVAALNRAFRGRAAATDVLSWPALPAEPGPDGAPPPLLAAPEGPQPRHLGDIALAWGVVEAQARDLALALSDHAIHLIVHGCLHLLGFDHRTDREAQVMEALEGRALAALGIDDPHA
jgi:probable rRNA maturation factor